MKHLLLAPLFALLFTGLCFSGYNTIKENDYSGFIFRRPSAPQNPEKSKEFFFGVDNSKIKEKAIKVNGSTISDNQAIHLIRSHARHIDASDKSIPDDINSLRVLILGQTPADTKIIADDIKSNEDIKKLTEGWVIKVYDKTNPTYKSIVEDVGYTCPNKQALYVVTPNGKVIHHQFVYEGPQDLRKVFSGIRKKDDKFDPNNSPNLLNEDLFSKLKDLVLNYVKSVPPIIWLVGIIVLFVIYKKK